MKRKALSILFLFISICFGYSQSKTACEKWKNELFKIVSLDDRLKFCHEAVSKVDVNCKIEIYILIGGIYADNMKVDSSFYYFDKAIQLASKEKKEELLAESYATKSSHFISLLKIEEAEKTLQKAKAIFVSYPKSKKKISYFSALASLENQKRNYVEAIKYCDSNIVLAKIHKVDQIVSTNYHNRGLYYFNLADYEKAAKSLLMAAQLKQKYKESDVGNTYYILGCCYEAWKQYETSIKYFNKAMLFSNAQKNYNVMLRIYVRLSKSNRNLNRFDAAKKAIDSAIYLAKKVDIKNQYAEALTEKGWLYLQNYKDTITAEKLYLKGHQAALESKDQGTIFFNLQSLLLLYYAKKDFKKAKPYLSVFEEAANACNSLVHTREKHGYYSKYYEGIGQYEKAFEHLKSSYKIKDSINSVSINTKVADLEKKYDTQTKELEIVSLGKEKSAQKLLIEKAEFKQNLFLLLALLLGILLFIGFWIFRKIKQQKEALAKAHDELEISNEKLTEIDAVKNRLFSIIAHDLRSMLIPFQRSGKLLTYFIDNKEEKQAIQLSKELEKNSYSLSNMLDNLLSWSLDQMNGYSYNPSVISVKKELEEILLVYKQQAIYKNTDLVLKYEEDASVLFDKGAFHVIFRNLIGNALKYTENGQIRVFFERDFNLLKFTIVDTGVGMTEEQVQNVFHLEENKTTIGTQGEKGTGIGLNLVYRFVQMHKGSVQVSSEKRLGTQFELTFPLTPVKEENDNITIESQSA